MNFISLGSTGRETTRLGYGCSRLMGSIGYKQSVALLEAAFDAGIRHFDVAPAYGGGQAEVCVGEFLSRHRQDVTVTTKYGVPVHDSPGLKLKLRRLVVPLIERVPGLKQRLQRATVAPAGDGVRESLPFHAKAVRASIENSLALLKTGHIDLFLLHEVIAEDLAADGAAESILKLLQDYVDDGTLGGFGCASNHGRITPIALAYPALCQNLQHEWSVLDPLLAPGPFRILHRSLSEHFPELHAALVADAPRTRRWSDFCGADLANPEVLARLMLKASLAMNPESVLLFSSKKPGHIQQNVALVTDILAEEQALKLYSLVRAEAQLLPGAEA